MTTNWFIVFLALIFIELITVNLVTVWFAVGAIAATITSTFTDSLLIQLIVFAVVSIITLLAIRPILKKIKCVTIEPTNLDMVIGKTGEVTKAIGKNKYGEVKVFGNTWTAKSDKVIDIGEKVKILSIEGVKLIVCKEEDKI